MRKKARAETFLERKELAAYLAGEAPAPAWYITRADHAREALNALESAVSLGRDGHTEGFRLAMRAAAARKLAAGLPLTRTERAYLSRRRMLETSTTR